MNTIDRRMSPLDGTDAARRRPRVRMPMAERNVLKDERAHILRRQRGRRLKSANFALLEANARMIVEERRHDAAQRRVRDEQRVDSLRRHSPNRECAPRRPARIGDVDARRAQAHEAQIGAVDANALEHELLDRRAYERKVGQRFDCNTLPHVKIADVVHVG